MNRRVVFVCFLCVVFFCSTGLCLAGENRVLLEEPSPGAENWIASKVLVTNPTINEVKPSMTSAPNGDLFVAVEDLDSIFINVDMHFTKVTTRCSVSRHERISQEPRGI